MNCTDFTTQPEAQAHLDAHPGDPDGLDRDDDDMACEGLPGAPEGASGDTDTGEDEMMMPTGGVDTGAGGTAGDEVTTGLIVAGGLALTAAGGLVLYRRRSLNS